jgi:IS5 family transposase
MTQMGFFDLSDRYASPDAENDPLIEIDSAVEWEEFRATLERVWRKPEAARKSRAGRKPLDAVLMFKTLVLGALYNLSDDRIEYQVRDRLSFMRFLGPGLGDRVPDARTVWLYREALAQAGMVETLFKQFDGYLARQGYIARGGQILDASIVPVPRNHNTRTENKAIKTKQSKQARYPRTGRTSLPNGLGRTLMLAGPRNTGATITATRTTSMWTVSTS